MVDMVYACTVFVCVAELPRFRTVNFATNRTPKVSDVLSGAGIREGDVQWVEYDDNRVQLDTVAKDQSTLIVYLRKNEIG
jgi:hypothetical protein